MGNIHLTSIGIVRDSTDLNGIRQNLCSTFASLRPDCILLGNDRLRRRSCSKQGGCASRGIGLSIMEGVSDSILMGFPGADCKVPHRLLLFLIAQLGSGIDIGCYGSCILNAGRNDALGHTKGTGKASSHS